MVKYSHDAALPNKSARAAGREIRTSFKNTHQVADAIRFMDLQDAKNYLQQVLTKDKCIPFRKFNGGIGRTAQAKEFGVDQGRWPQKSVKIVLSLLQNLEANAEAKDLDTDNMTLVHVMVNRAQQGRRRTYRAHGRINAFKSSPCHIEMIAQERAEDVKKPDTNSRFIRMNAGALKKKVFRLSAGF